MAKLRDLKKDILLLSDDLNSIVSIKVFVENVPLSSVSDLVQKINDFYGSFIDKVNNPGVTVAKSDRKAYAKAMRTAYKAISIDLYKQYSDLADEISKLK